MDQLWAWCCRTYAFVRGASRRTTVGWPLIYGAMIVRVGGVTDLALGATLQWVLIAAVLGLISAATGIHFWMEACMRPIRRAITDLGEAGDHLPRSRPSFAVWLASANACPSSRTMI